MSARRWLPLVLGIVLSGIAIVGAVAPMLLILTAATAITACPSETSPAATPQLDGLRRCAATDQSFPVRPAGSNATGTNGSAGIAAQTAIAAVERHGRYVVEGNGPVNFDCSGLTAFAWRAAGVNLIDYSYSQWSQTQRISRTELAPGDLIFWFGGNVHHVAIVVAVSGPRVQIAEAANPQSGVRIRDFGDAWDAQYVSGYGRVLLR